MLRVKRDWAVASAIAIVWLLFTAAVYLDDVGRGFIKDDFGWVLDGTAALQHPLRSFVGGWQGNFYRPWSLSALASITRCTVCGHAAMA